MMESVQFGFYIGFDERVLHLDVLENGGERRVAAVVGPIGVQYPQLSLCRITMLLCEVFRYASEVIGVHRQSPLFAESGILFFGHSGKPG